MAKHGVDANRTHKFGKGGREFLAALKLREGPRRRLDSLLALIDDLDREIDKTPCQHRDEAARLLNCALALRSRTAR